jgi:cytochrome c biogenesis protein CcmG/thiol:disulfide interchange protein DsbE
MLKLSMLKLPVVLFVMIMTLLCSGLNLSAREISSALIGKPFPKFNLPNLDPDKPDISEKILKGQITIVHFWASWCGSCRKEQMVLTALDKSDDFQLVGINYKDSRKNADLWLNKLGNPYTVNIFDASGILGSDLGIYGTPTTYIIDQDGIIRYRHVGALTKELWIRKIHSEIKKLKT